MTIERAIITEGDKLTIITERDILICSVVSIRSRATDPTSTYHWDKAVERILPCNPEATAELQVKVGEMMKRNA